MAKKSVKKAVKKAAPKKKAAAKKKAAKKSQMIIDFKNEKEGTTVCIKATNVSPQLMSMAHDALGQAIIEEMTGFSTKKG